MNPKETSVAKTDDSDVTQALGGFLKMQEKIRILKNSIPECHMFNFILIGYPGRMFQEKNAHICWKYSTGYKDAPFPRHPGPTDSDRVPPRLSQPEIQSPLPRRR
ncbi:hypothetical protein EVAR_50747_1 [Eumeta japonica]|uniref:Uncharacterized protein n=1 Tax=Eumeta variegata TaxID=151549 RepID=A0A4C1Y269_EUMVA|nr:hypothetical protein EVAR_50747_1 [Eumeta japonica]